MATATSRVVVVRMRDGGVLTLAPASVMPWPQVIDRSLRRLQEEGLSRALHDPSALSRLQAEAAGLLGDPPSRAAVRRSGPALVDALLAAARQDRLTVIYGHGEPSLRNGRPEELPGSYQAHPVVAAGVPKAAAPYADPLKSLPTHEQPLPPTFPDRLLWICGRAPLYMSPDAALPMREFFGPTHAGVTAAVLNLWAGAGSVGIGFAVDAAVFAAAVSQLGRDAVGAFDDMREVFDLGRDATSWNMLDQSARKLAFASSTLGPGLFRQLLRRIGGRTGAMGQTDGAGGAGKPLSLDAVMKGSPGR